MKSKLILLSVFFLIGAGCSTTSKTETINLNNLPPARAEAPISGVPQNIPSNWKEYKNTSEAYTIFYPPDFTVEQNKEVIEEVTHKVTSFSFPKADLVKTIPEAKVYIASEKAPCADLSKTAGVEKRPELTMQEDVYFVYSWGEGAAGSQYGGTIYQTEKNERCYRVSFFTKTTTPENFASSGQEGISLKEEQDATLHGLQLIFETILSTFKV